MRLGAVIFVAPFFFVFHPVILFERFQIGSFILVVLSAVAGFWLLARGFEGYAPPATWAKHLRRIVAIAASILVLSMVWYAQAAGAALAIGLLLSGGEALRIPFLARVLRLNRRAEAERRPGVRE